jgi:hypothetical protein
VSTITGIGPALDIDGPLPVARPYGLLSVPGVLITGDGRWLNGVNVDGYPSEVPTLWDPCSSGTYRDKDEGSARPGGLFAAFTAYVPITCSAMSIGRDWRAFANRAELVLDATLSFAAEEALSMGVTGQVNPFLGDGGVTILGGGAVTPGVGLSWLENAIGQTGRGGIIHATPPVVTAWSEFLHEDEETIYTFNGTPVAAGAGYIGATANGSAAASGQAWAFASGPVQVRFSDTQLVGDDISGTLDTSNNDVTFRAERYGLATWDTALQAAVLIDWTP